MPQDEGFNTPEGGLPWIYKDPNAVLDYTLDFARWLRGNDTLTSAVFTASAGLTVDDDSNGDTTATVWLSGGTVGEEYTVRCHVEASGGQEDDRSFKVHVKER